MRNKSNLYFLLFILLLQTFQVFSQETIVKGRVTDIATNDAVPFANVKFKGITTGTSADFDGYFSIRTNQRVDSLKVDYLGYKSKTKKVKSGQSQVINFQLQSASMGIREVVVKAGVNPAIQIIKDAQKRKDGYDKRNLSSLQYENYAKIQIDVDNISDRLRSKRILSPLTALFDSLDSQAGEDSKANMPMFYSENLSDVYFVSSPFQKKKEIIKASKITAVGIQDGILSSQFTGNSFEEYNFNRNKVLVFGKEFLSPLADNSLLFYDFYLTDTVVLNGFRCYQIKVKPKNDKDLLFTGNIWIADTVWALKQVNLEIPKTVNINFLEKVQVQQELEPSGAGAWLVTKSRLVVDFADVTNRTVGMIARVYNSIKYIKVNEAIPLDFFDNPIRLERDALDKDDSYWAANRHERLSQADYNAFAMIDTIRNIPRVKLGVDIFYTVVTGHYEYKKVDIGPVLSTLSYNYIEGYKLRFGGRTNIYFSDTWIIRGYIAYGLRDERFKYNLQVEKILSKTKWTKVGVMRREDIDQAGVQFEYDDSPAFDNELSSLYVTTSAITQFALLNLKTENRAWIEREIRSGITGRVTFQNIDYKHYYNTTSDSAIGAAFQQDFTTTEIVLEARFAWNETKVYDVNKRYIVGNSQFPILNVQYIKGIKGLMGSDLNYSRLNLKVNHRVRMGFLGYSRYLINAGKVFSPAPYTLLEIHRGNQTPFFAYATFNMMNYFEFISDEYVSIDYVHHFQGLFFNRVPLLRQLKWRELVTFRAVYGTLSKNNQTDVITKSFSTLTNKPYMEAGFGISGILRFVRVDFIYRLNYLDDAYKKDYAQLQLNNGIAIPQSVYPFGVKVSLQFAF